MLCAEICIRNDAVNGESEYFRGMQTRYVYDEARTTFLHVDCFCLYDEGHLPDTEDLNEWTIIPVGMDDPSLKAEFYRDDSFEGSGEIVLSFSTYPGASEDTCYRVTPVSSFSRLSFSILFY